MVVGEQGGWVGGCMCVKGRRWVGSGGHRHGPSIKNGEKGMTDAADACLLGSQCVRPSRFFLSQRSPVIHPLGSNVKANAASPPASPNPIPCRPTTSARPKKADQFRGISLDECHDTRMPASLFHARPKHPPQAFPKKKKKKTPCSACPRPSTLICP